MGFLPDNVQLATSFHTRHRVRHGTDRWIDRVSDNGHALTLWRWGHNNKPTGVQWLRLKFKRKQTIILKMPTCNCVTITTYENVQNSSHKCEDFQKIRSFNDGIQRPWFSSTFQVFKNWKKIQWFSRNSEHRVRSTKPCVLLYGCAGAMPQSHYYIHCQQQLQTLIRALHVLQLHQSTPPLSPLLQ